MIGIDFGEKRIGVAVTDPLWITAQPVGIIENRGDGSEIEEISSILSEYDAETIVLGLPRNMDGSEGFKAQETRSFGELLAEKTGAEVVYQDERLSSAMVDRGLAFSGVKAKKRKKNIDDAAAQLILQNYMQKIQVADEG